MKSWAKQIEQNNKLEWEEIEYQQDLPTTQGINPALIEPLIDLVKSKTTTSKRKLWNSYVLKHMFEPYMPKKYIHNSQMKAILLLAGYEPKNTDGTNWLFKLTFTDKEFEEVAPKC